MLSNQLQVIGKPPRLLLAKHVYGPPFFLGKSQEPLDWVYQLGILGINRKRPVFNEQAGF
jgi:hypothetical protein